MPVVPVLAYIGTAVGASAGTAAAVGGVVVASTAAAAYGTYASVQASRKQAAVASSVANYNAKVDVANAQQLEMDSAANVAKQRRDNAVYLASQRAAYSASGVLGGTGSPMAVLATGAGRMEQDIQQYHSDINKKEEQLYESAAQGVAEGGATAEAYHLQGSADLFRGIGSVANIAGSWMSRFDTSGSGSYKNFGSKRNYGVDGSPALAAGYA